MKLKLCKKNENLLKQNSDLIDKAKVIKDNLEKDFLNNKPWTGWWKLNSASNEKIKKVVKNLRNIGVKKMVSIGIGGSFLGAKSAINFLNKNKNDVIFAGYSFSDYDIHEAEEKLGNEDFAICVISKSGNTLETTLAYSFFYKKLKERFNGNKEEINKRLIIITGRSGTLREYASKEGITTFDVPESIGGRFSFFTSVGLLPLQFCGIDIDKIVEEDKDQQYDDIYKYAVLRYLHRNRNFEIIGCFASSTFDFAEWQKQLFAESEGKDDKGLMPIIASYSKDLHSIGQFIQEGTPNFIQTLIWVKNNDLVKKVSIDNDLPTQYKKYDNKTFNYFNEKVYQAILLSHRDERGIPTIRFEIESNNEQCLSKYYLFMMKTCAIYCKLLGVDPFDQPGVESYKKNMRV